MRAALWIVGLLTLTACGSPTADLEDWASEVAAWHAGQLTAARDDLIVEGLGEEACRRALDRLEPGGSELLAAAPHEDARASFRVFLDDRRRVLLACSRGDVEGDLPDAWGRLRLDIAELGVVLPDVEPDPLTTDQEERVERRVADFEYWIDERLQPYLDSRGSFLEVSLTDPSAPQRCRAWQAYLDEAEPWLLPSGVTRIDTLVEQHFREERLLTSACIIGHTERMIEHMDASGQALSDLFDLLSGE